MGFDDEDEPALKQARVEGPGAGFQASTEAKLQVPESADLNFLKKILAGSSQYLTQIYEETAVNVSLGVENGRTVVMMRADPNGSLNQAKTRIEKIYSLPPDRQVALLTEYCLPSLAQLQGGGAGMAAMGVLPVQAHVETTPMDFSKTGQDHGQGRSIPVPRQLWPHLATAKHRLMIKEMAGTEVVWDHGACQVNLRGSADQLKAAARLVARVLMHCRWGSNEAKVSRLLKPKQLESALVRLSPMSALRPAQKLLNTAHPTMTMGKDKNNDAVIKDGAASRLHCVLELDKERGAVYCLDLSTNGTYLNGLRLPGKDAGKVLLSHGDELLFKDPAAMGGDPEFGFIVNIEEMAVKEDIKLVAPRRILSAEENAERGPDF